MPGERLSTQKIRELLRLRWEQHLPQRVVANGLRLLVATHPGSLAFAIPARDGSALSHCLGVAQNV